MSKLSSHLATILFAVAPLSGLQGENNAAIAAVAVETVDVVFDGKKDGSLAAGTEVAIIGEKNDEGLSLIRYKSSEGTVKMGLVPTRALVESRSETTNPAMPTGPAPDPVATATAVDLEQNLTATQLAEYLEANRDDFANLAGKIAKVNGVVEAIRVSGQVGSMVTAEITLKTRPDLPKIRLMVHASEFMDDSSGDRFEMRVQGRTLEGRSRDTRYPYRYWYWYNGYWRSRNVAKSEWVPIISIGEPLQGSGALGKYHIHVDLEGAKIDKD